MFLVVELGYSESMPASTRQTSFQLLSFDNLDNENDCTFGSESRRTYGDEIVVIILGTEATFNPIFGPLLPIRLIEQLR